MPTRANFWLVLVDLIFPVFCFKSLHWNNIGLNLSVYLPPTILPDQKCFCVPNRARFFILCSRFIDMFCVCVFFAFLPACLMHASGTIAYFIYLCTLTQNCAYESESRTLQFRLSKLYGRLDCRTSEWGMCLGCVIKGLQDGKNNRIIARLRSSDIFRQVIVGSEFDVVLRREAENVETLLNN